MDAREKELLESQLKRLITRVFKDALVVLEDIRQDHLSVVHKIQGQFPPEFVGQFNYLDLGKYSRHRKKVLDAGNDALREMQSILSDFDQDTDNKEKG